jgi:hypothetical protein
MQALKFFRSIRLVLLGSVLLLASVPAFSQSCALCYTQAASAGKRMVQALKSGILVLVVPPTFMSVGMIFVVRRKNKQVRRTDENENDESGQDW